MNETIKARARTGRTRALAILMTGLLAGSALATLPMLGGVAGATGSFVRPGPWTVSLSPGAACAGSTVTFTFAFTNNGNKTIASAYLKAPGGISIPAQSGLVVTGAPTGYPGAKVAAGTNLLELRRVYLTVGKTASVQFSATIGTTAGPQSWIVEAESSDHYFDNDPADTNDDFQLTPNSPPVTTVYGGCHLAFTVQPKDAGQGQVITSTALDASAPGRPTVQVQDGLLNAPVPVATSVTMTLNGASTLSGGATLPSSNGTVAFPALSATPAAPKVTLTATAAPGSGIASGTSDPFTIWGAAQPCGSSGCSVQAPTDNGQTFGVTGSSTSGGGVAASVGFVNIDCSAKEFGGIPEIAGTRTVTFTYTGSGTKTLSIFVPKTLLVTPKDQLLAAYYMVCFSAPHTFPIALPTGLPISANSTAAADPTVTAAMNDGQTWYTGLLPSCWATRPTDTPPCVVSRVWSSTGLTATIVVPEGDPHAR